jgi:Cytochrome P450
MEELHQLGQKLAIADSLPFMRFPLASVLRRVREVTEKYRRFVEKKLVEHKLEYQQDIIRDFADALLSSKDEAIKENKENAQYLNDYNLTLTLTNLFQAGCKLN